MITAILLFPLLGFFLNAFFGKRFPKALVSIIACFSVFCAFGLSFYYFIQFIQWPESWRSMTVPLFSWIPTLGVDFSLKMDPLSQLLSLIVTGVGFLIHLYSVHYMKGDAGFSRYFSYLNLFTFSMLLLVLANNLLVLFIGWEGVGLCSYLLIGFWFEDEEKAAAGKKAFIVNRIGDLSFLLALFFIYKTFGTLNIESLSLYDFSDISIMTLTTITLLLFGGACGKSAQIPLYVWLPDAMAGPTPVSALIHAATMVTAGVYMIARLNFMYVLAPVSMHVVAIVGLSTALFSASIALFQNDIKKVLAYSTISQLGFMFLAVGIGAFSTAIFHLITHAFFKALLFLAAGSVIHALHHEQNIHKMGGLRSKLPLTHITFLFGVLAIIGMPPFSGFFSKDEILWMAFNHHPILWFFAWIGAMMTTFYMVRLFTLVFYGKPSEHSHLHEAPSFMALALIILSIFSCVGGFIGVPHLFHRFLPFPHFLEVFLSPLFRKEINIHYSHTMESLLMIFTILSTVGMAIFSFVIFHRYSAWTAHIKIKFLAVYQCISNKYYIDEAYDFLLVKPLNRIAHLFLRWVDLFAIEGIVNGLGRLNIGVGTLYGRFQNGNLQTYAFGFVLGVIFIFLYYWGKF